MATDLADQHETQRAVRSRPGNTRPSTLLHKNLRHVTQATTAGKGTSASNADVLYWRCEGTGTWGILWQRPVSVHRAVRCLFHRGNRQEEEDKEKDVEWLLLSFAIWLTDCYCCFCWFCSFFHWINSVKSCTTHITKLRSDLRVCASLEQAENENPGGNWLTWFNWRMPIIRVYISLFVVIFIYAGSSHGMHKIFCCVLEFVRLSVCVCLL